MTCIAWDGATLAADKRCALGSLIRTTTKIFNFGDCFAGYAGDAAVGEELVAWFKAGHVPADFPESQRSKDSWTSLLVIWRNGDIWKFESTPHAVKFPPQQFAIGSGRDFAMAAMHCGKTAQEAVEVACVFDNGCGNGVDILSFAPSVSEG
jgi:20S proteasome alpha/beta subunit